MVVVVVVVVVVVKGVAGGERKADRRDEPGDINETPVGRKGDDDVVKEEVEVEVEVEVGMRVLGCSLGIATLAA